jgi:hypothetical protein
MALLAVKAFTTVTAKNVSSKNIGAERNFFHFEHILPQSWNGQPVPAQTALG